MNETEKYTLGLSTMKVMLSDGAYMPERAHTTDAGLDLRTPVDVTIPGVTATVRYTGMDKSHINANLGSVTIDTGVHIALPHGTYGKIESKSGLNVNHGIVSCGGVIDEGYTGSIVVKLYNMTDMPYQFNAGDKIAQLVIMPYKTPIMERVDSLETRRTEAQAVSAAQGGD